MATTHGARYAAVIATVLLLGLGLFYYLAVQRRRTGILSEHAAPSLLGGGSLDLDVLAEFQWTDHPARAGRLT